MTCCIITPSGLGLEPPQLLQVVFYFLQECYHNPFDALQKEISQQIGSLLHICQENCKDLGIS